MPGNLLQKESRYVNFIYMDVCICMTVPAYSVISLFVANA